MRLIITLIAIFCLSDLGAQQQRLLKKVNGKVELSEIVVADSLSAAHLFFNAKLFLAEAFQGVRETSQIKDEKAKLVATKGSFPVSFTKENGEEAFAKIVFKLMIQCKDNLYKYTFDDFYIAKTEYTGVTLYASFNDRLGISFTTQQWQEVEEQAEKFFEDFAAALKEQMIQTEVPHEATIVIHHKRKNNRNR